MRIIGIDPAPGRGGHIYEGGDSVCFRCPKCLGEFLDGIREDVLIAWDAPLTASTDPDGPLIEQDLTKRMIETFFTRRKFKHKAPKGISVLDYSRCSHWTISRRLLGLPRTGPYDSAELPFTLVVQDDPLETGRNVVEVHPALALWLWFRSGSSEPSWEYKKSASPRAEIWELLRTQFSSTLPKGLFADGRTPDDDELDAVSAWLLASLWLSRQGVSLLGDGETGALLLPKDEVLHQEFQRFRNKELARRQGARCRCT